MKKKIFLVSALVLMAMGAMFVSCKKGSIKNGCTCTMSDGYYTETEFITGAEMQEVADEIAEYYNVAITTCSDYSDFVMRYWGMSDYGTIKCK